MEVREFILTVFRSSIVRLPLDFGGQVLVRSADAYLRQYKEPGALLRRN
jgi:hypothetical protein